jgi:hypothetical protein
MATQKQQQQEEATPRQRAAMSRISKIDEAATFEVVGDWVKATYTPMWERRYHERDVPNPQRIVFALTPQARIQGWGFTAPGAKFEALIAQCPFGSDLTTPESMKQALKERAEARSPKPEAKEEPEAKQEPKADAEADNKVSNATTRKSAATKQRRKTGVKVTR